MVSLGVTVHKTELHVFCDVSENDFGSVAYLRIITDEGNISTAFVMSRTRLAPLKRLTIVRLELQAAVLGVRLTGFIKQELSLPVEHTYYWTDSEVVLQYLRNENRRYHTFVANRIAEIHEGSKPGQWNHVPSQENPADACSRGTSAADLKTHAIWWSEPGFLSGGQEEWPSQSDTPVLDLYDPEVKKPQETVLATQVDRDRLLDPSPYSSWVKYKRTVAWIIRFVRNAKQKTRGDRTWGPLSVSEIRAAEESQHLAFRNELKATEDGSAVPASSSLASFSSFLDCVGLLRARSRLHNAYLPETTRHPVVLHAEEDITRLIVDEAHKRLMHAELEHTLADIQVTHWIPKGRAAVKKIIHKCAVCRNRRAKPRPPKMADLPQERFDTSRPFACVGVDFCGPFTVRKLRRTEKRDVLLITCLATRAVHLEVAYSLASDCFVMTLRRFTARRGARPRVIWCDSGTNLVAGERSFVKT